MLGVAFLFLWGFLGGILLNSLLIVFTFFLIYLGLTCSNIFHWKIGKKARKQILAVLLRVWSCTAEVNGSFVIDFSRSRIWTSCSFRTHRNQSSEQCVILKKKTSYHILTVTVAQQSVAECQLNFLFKYTGNVICFSNVYNNSPLQLYYKSFLETGIIVFFFFSKKIRKLF